MDRTIRKAIVSGRRSIWLPAIVFMVLVSIGLVCANRNQNRPFDSELWRSEPRLRASMVDDLLQQKQLDGLSMTEVVHMLGPPSHVGNETHVYWTGSDGGIDDMWLEIHFHDDIVAETRHVPD